VQACLHGSAAGVALDQAGFAQDLIGVCSLADGDSLLLLMNLDPQVIAQRTDIAHLEHLLHLLLEVVQNVDVTTSDDQVIDVHSHNQSPVTAALCVHAMRHGVALEAELHE
jgi:hypothetical protein